MNTPGDDSSKSAKNRLSSACRTKDTSVRLAWAITICEAVLLAGFGLALADYWLMLPVWMRSIGALIVASLALFGMIRLIRFYCRPTPLKEAALDLEAQKPELGCEVSTAAEYLTGERKPVHEYEPELAAALQKKAAGHLDRAQFSYEKKLVRPALVLGATLLALLAFVLVAPVAFVALQRTALPFSKARYTEVKVQPGNIEVPVGTSIEVTNVFTGRTPKDPQFHWQEARNPAWQTAALKKSAEGTYVYALKDLHSNVTYQVTGNDAVSDQYTVKTYIPPAVKDLTIRVEFPAYTKLPPAVQKTQDIAVVRASVVQMRIEPTVGLSSAKLRFSKLPELALSAGDDGLWTASLKVTQDTDYWIELADKSGHRGVNDKPYHIKAVPDQPPKVEIVEPGKDIRASATNKIPIKISAMDDFGVADVRLVFHKLGGSEQVASATRQGEHNGEVTATAELDLASLGLHEYELVAYHAEATDNNTLDGPGIGKSPVYFVEITNEKAGTCLSQIPSQKVNLLVIQKQIIADTTALSSQASAEKFQELSARQRDAVEFGKMYQEALSAGGDAGGAGAELAAAIHDMESAGGSLDHRKRADAIPPEESALAHLYQVLKLMPELGNLPTAPPAAGEKPPPSPKVKVVLEAIKQKKKDQPNNQEIEQALEDAKDLARSQAALSAAARNAGESDSQQEGQKPGEGQGKGQGKGKGKGDQKSQAQGQGQGEGEGQGQGQGKGQGQGQPQGDGKDDPNQPKPNPAEMADAKSPEKMEAKETELSKEAAALAERLQRLAGKDTRVGHNAGKNAARASAKMASAAKAMGNGGFAAAGEQGFEGEMALRALVAELERILKDQPEPTDVAHEDFPKEYEAVISEYLKKLSHAE